MTKLKWNVTLSSNINNCDICSGETHIFGIGEAVCIEKNAREPGRVLVSALYKGKSYWGWLFSEALA